MKKIWILLVIIVLVAGFFIWKSRRAEMPPRRDIKPFIITGTNEEKEEEIRKRLSRAMADMRLLATGIESFYVDHTKYPENLYALTSPIAYLTRVLKDPFTVDTDMGYRKLGEDDWIVWSIGPDGRDDSGQIIYDPKNGTISSGDIVRRKQ